MNISLYANASINETGEIASCYDFAIISNINDIKKTLSKKIVETFEALKKETDTSSLQIASYLKLLYSSYLVKLFTFDPELNFYNVIGDYSDSCYKFSFKNSGDLKFDTYLANFSQIPVVDIFRYSNFIEEDDDILSSFINLLNELCFFLDAEYKLNVENGVLTFIKNESGEIIV